MAHRMQKKSEVKPAESIAKFDPEKMTKWRRSLRDYSPIGEQPAKNSRTQLKPSVLSKMLLEMGETHPTPFGILYVIV